MIAINTKISLSTWLPVIIMVVILCLFVVIGILVEEPQAGYYTTSYAIRDANDRIDALEVRVKWLEKEIKTLRQNTRFKTILFEEGG